MNDIITASILKPIGNITQTFRDTTLVSNSNTTVT